MYFGVDRDWRRKTIAILEALPIDISEVIKGAGVKKRLALFKKLPDASESVLSGTSSRYTLLVVKTEETSVVPLIIPSENLREIMVQVESWLHVADSVKVDTILISWW